MKRIKSSKHFSHFIFEDLLQYAILPSVFIIGAKIVSMTVLSFFGGISLQIIPNYSNPLFPFTLVFGSYEDKIFIMSYSNLFMFLVVLVGAMVIATRSTLIIRSKQSSTFVLKLARYDLLNLVNSSYETYKEVFVWSVFLVITSVYLVFSAFANNTYSWISYIAVTATLFFLWVIIRNIQIDLYLLNKIK